MSGRSVRRASATLALSWLCAGCGNVLGLDELVFDLDAGKENDSGSLDYAATVLADGPIAYWRFDETSGSKVLDASGHGRDGTCFGVALGATGAVGGNAAAGFDGSSSYCTFGDIFDFEGTQPFSVEAWISASPAIPNFSRVLSKETYAAQNNDGWDLTVFIQSGKAQAKLERWVSGNVVCDAISPAFDPDLYAHVVAVYGAGTAELAANGKSSGPRSCGNDAGLAATSASLVAGKPANAADDYFEGSLDELAVYDRALGPAEVSRHYQKGLE
jgi:hypothetical protein